MKLAQLQHSLKEAGCPDHSLGPDMRYLPKAQLTENPNAQERLRHQENDREADPHPHETIQDNHHTQARGEDHRLPHQQDKKRRPFVERELFFLDFVKLF